MRVAPVEADLQCYSACEFSCCKTGLFGQSLVGCKTFHCLFPLFCPLLSMGTMGKSRRPHPFGVAPRWHPEEAGNDSQARVTQGFLRAQAALPAVGLQGCHEERSDLGEDNAGPTHSSEAKVPTSQLARRSAAGFNNSLPCAAALSVPRRWRRA